MKKGLVFTLDAIFALLILLAIIPLVENAYVQSVSPSLIHEQLHLQSEDVSNVLVKIKTGEALNESTVLQQLLTEQRITQDDMSLPLIEVIGRFWAANTTADLAIARDIIQDVVGNLTPKSLGWATYFDQDQITANFSPLNLSLYGTAASKRIVSGFEKNKTLSGCIARTFLERAIGKQAAKYYFFGGFIGQGNVSATVRGVPSDANISLMYLEANFGDNFTLYVNGNHCANLSKSPGNYSVDAFSLNSSSYPQCIGNVSKGADNNFSINFSGNDLEKQFIGGGFIKIVYDTGQLSYTQANLSRYYFPGVSGIINNYDSFYVPGNVTNITAFIDYYSNYSVYFNVGNTTIFNRSGSTSRQNFTITNASFASNFSDDYSQLGGQSVPIRIGIDPLAFVNSTTIGNADVILITDLSGSMSWRIDSNTASGANTSCTECSDSCINASNVVRINKAKCVDLEFVDIILNNSGNRVGLTGFNTNADTSYTGLTADKTSLQSQINGYSAGGGTCVCCSINRAYDLIQEPYYETLVPRQNEWSYNTSFATSAPWNDAEGDNWTTMNYNDSLWSKANASLGFGGVDSDIGNNLVLLSNEQLNASEYELAYGSVISGTLGDTNKSDGTNALVLNESLVLPPVYYYNESEGQSSTTSTSWQEKTRLDFSPIDGNYLILVTAEVQGSSSSRDVQLRMTIDGQTHSEINWEPDISSNWEPFVSHKLRSLDSSSHNITIEYSSENSGQTTRIRNARISAIRLDEYVLNESESESTLTSTYADKTNVSFTPSSDGYYLVIATAEVKAGSTTSSIGARLQIGSTTYDEVNIEGENSNEYKPFASHSIYQFTASPQTVHLQAFSEGGSASKRIRRARISVVRLTDFLNYQYQESLSRTTTTSTSWVNKTSLSFTPASEEDYLIVASAQIDYPTPSNSRYPMARMLVDGVEYGYMLWGLSDSSDKYNFFSTKNISLSASPHTITIQYRTRSSSYAIGMSNAKISATRGGTTQQYRLETRFNSTTLSDDQNVSSINATIRFNSTQADNYSIRLYDYSSNAWNTQYCSTAQVVLANQWTTMDCNVTANASNFVSANGKVQASLNAQASSAYNNVSIDFVQYYLETTSGNYYFRKNFSVANASDIIYLNLSVYSDDRAEIYLNGVLVDNDTQPHPASYWNRQINASSSYLNTGENVLAVKLRNHDSTSAKFDLELNASKRRNKYIIVMTDGITGYSCASSGCSGNNTAGTWDCGGGSGDCTGSQCDCAIDNANYSACRARTLPSTLYSVGFGPISTCQNGNRTLQNIATCGGGSYYSSSNASELQNIYRSIAEQIVNQSIVFRTQTANVSANVSNMTLYPSSYLEFSYQPFAQPPQYRQIKLSVETDAFANCTGSFFVPPADSIEEAKITSYSEDYWTSIVIARNGSNPWGSAFNLSVYGQNYTFLGDPFVVNIPTNLLKTNATNYVNISTGADSANTSSQCSTNNKAIYSYRITLQSFLSPVFANCTGRNVSVYFDKDNDAVSDGSVNIAIGQTPVNTTLVTPDQLTPSTNAADYALLQLLDSLNFDNQTNSIQTSTGRSGTSQNPIDLEIPSTLKVDTTVLSDIPYMWGPAEIQVSMWT